MILREDESTYEDEEAKRENEIEKLEFNVNNEIHGSDGSTESKEEVGV